MPRMTLNKAFLSSKKNDEKKSSMMTTTGRIFDDGKIAAEHGEPQSDSADVEIVQLVRKRVDACMKRVQKTLLRTNPENAINTWDDQKYKNGGTEKDHQSNDITLPIFLQPDGNNTGVLDLSRLNLTPLILNRVCQELQNAHHPCLSYIHSLSLSHNVQLGGPERPSGTSGQNITSTSKDAATAVKIFNYADNIRGHQKHTLTSLVAIDGVVDSNDLHGGDGGLSLFFKNYLPKFSASMNCLDLFGIGLTDDSLISLVAILPYTRLRKLRIGDNLVTSKGVKALVAGMIKSTRQENEEEGTDGQKRSSNSSHQLFSPPSSEVILQQLHIGGNPIGDEGLTAICELFFAAATSPCITAIQRNNDDDDDDDGDDVLFPWTNSKKEFGSSSSNDDNDCCSFLENLGLRNIHLSNSYSSLKRLSMALSSPFCRLTELQLRENQLQDAAFLTLAEGLKHNFTLTHLDVQCNEMTDVSAVAFFSAFSFHSERKRTTMANSSSSLRVLSVGRNKIGNQGLLALATMLVSPCCSSLINLELDENAFDGDGMEGFVEKILGSFLPSSLQNSQYHPGNVCLLPLSALSLSKNAIGDKGAKALARLLPATITSVAALHPTKQGDIPRCHHICPCLHTLEIAKCNIGPDGFTALMNANAHNQCQLKHLCISQNYGGSTALGGGGGKREEVNRIGGADAMAAMLQTNTKLSRLMMADNEMTLQDMMKIGGALFGSCCFSEQSTGKEGKKNNNEEGRKVGIAAGNTTLRYFVFGGQSRTRPYANDIDGRLRQRFNEHLERNKNHHWAAVSQKRRGGKVDEGSEDEEKEEKDIVVCPSAPDALSAAPIFCCSPFSSPKPSSSLPLSYFSASLFSTLLEDQYVLSSRSSSCSSDGKEDKKESSFFCNAATTDKANDGRSTTDISTSSISSMSSCSTYVATSIVFSSIVGSIGIAAEEKFTNAISDERGKVCSLPSIFF